MPVSFSWNLEVCKVDMGYHCSLRPTTSSAERDLMDSDQWSGKRPNPMSEMRTLFSLVQLVLWGKQRLPLASPYYTTGGPLTPCLSISQMPCNLTVSPHLCVPSTSTSTNAGLLWSVPYASGQLGIWVLMGYKAQLVLCMFYKAFRTEAIG